MTFRFGTWAFGASSPGLQTSTIGHGTLNMGLGAVTFGLPQGLRALQSIPWFRKSTPSFFRGFRGVTGISGFAISGIRGRFRGRISPRFPVRGFAGVLREHAQVVFGEVASLPRVCTAAALEESPTFPRLFPPLRSDQFSEILAIYWKNHPRIPPAPPRAFKFL